MLRTSCITGGGQETGAVGRTSGKLSMYRLSVSRVLETMCRLSGTLCELGVPPFRIGGVPPFRIALCRLSGTGFCFESRPIRLRPLNLTPSQRMKSSVGGSFMGAGRVLPGFLATVEERRLTLDAALRHVAVQ
jgi:hypothetical protein